MFSFPTNPESARSGVLRKRIAVFLGALSCVLLQGCATTIIASRFAAQQLVGPKEYPSGSDFQSAVARGDLAYVRASVASNPYYIKRQEGFPLRTAIAAATYGHTNIVAYLIEEDWWKVNDAVSNYQASGKLIDIAVREGRSDTVAYLISRGATLSTASGRSGDQLIVVTSVLKRARTREAQYVSIARMLIAAGENPDAQYSSSQPTALMNASSACSPEMIALLLEHGANPHREQVGDRSRATALSLAKRGSCISGVQLLEAAGAK